MERFPRAYACREVCVAYQRGQNDACRIYCMVFLLRFQALREAFGMDYEEAEE